MNNIQGKQEDVNQGIPAGLVADVQDESSNIDKTGVLSVSGVQSNNHGASSRNTKEIEKCAGELETETPITRGAASVGKDSKFSQKNGVGNWCYKAEMLNKEGETEEFIKAVCGPLDYKGSTRDQDSTKWGSLVEFKDPDKKKHRIATPYSKFAGDSNEILASYLDAGLVIYDQKLFLQLLQELKNDIRYRAVDKIGWNGDCFVLTEKTIGDSSTEKTVFQSESGQIAKLHYRGTTQDWINNVGSLAKRNFLLMFIISIAAVAPLLKLANILGFIIHLRGKSSTGKTTFLKVGSSLFGMDIKTWRATGNGLESVCAAHNDIGLYLDELGQVSGKEVGQITYMIGNGTGKTRANKSGAARKTATWNLPVTSTGEVSLQALMQGAGVKIHAGQEVRFIDIPINGDYGAFDYIPEQFKNAGHFADELVNNSELYQGVVGLKFLEKLVNNQDVIRANIDEQIESFVIENLPKNSDGQVRRVCRNFGVIAFAGGLLTKWGLSGWNVGDADKAAATIFKTWLDNRGTSGDQETLKVIHTFKKFFLNHGESRFQPTVDDSKVYHNRVGFRDNSHYFILRTGLHDDILKGYNAKDSVKILRDAGAFIHDSNDRSTQSRTFPNLKKQRVYIVNSEFLGGEDDAN